MRRKLICAALALALVLLAACGAQVAEASPTPGQLQFTRESFPRLDGSTSTAPLGRAMAAVLLGESEEAVADLIDFSRTTESYRELMRGNADLVIAAEPNASVFEGMEAAGFEIEMQPFANDALVFMVNENNPVDSLTAEQLRGIYSGEITNWSELGGNDAPIAVLGRDAASGTRGAFEEILGIEDQCVYLNEYASTGDVVGNVASNPNAIGYASLSAVDETVTAVAINGVVPTEETVADGTFAIQRPFVIVTVEGTELSPAAQAFLDYAMSAEAAPVIESAGVVPANG